MMSRARLDPVSQLRVHENLGHHHVGSERKGFEVARAERRSDEGDKIQEVLARH